MYANALIKRSNSPNRFNNISRKYYLTCKDRITADNPTTNDWLEVKELLKESDSRDLSRVLKGVLEKKKDVVIKISDRDTLEKEYAIGEYLQQVPGFLRPICFFKCKGIFKQYPKRGTDALCEGPGTSMAVLVMPYFSMKSMLDHAWLPERHLALRACLLQIVASLVQAYEQKGLIHNDMHLENVLLSKTTRKTIPYLITEKEVNVQTYGYRITIMDYEQTLIEDPEARGTGIRFLFKDIKHMLSDFYYSRDLEVLDYAELDKALTQLEVNATYPMNFYKCVIGIAKYIEQLRFAPRPKLLTMPVYNPHVLGGGS